MCTWFFPYFNSFFSLVSFSCLLHTHTAVSSAVASVFALIHFPWQCFSTRWWEFSLQSKSKNDIKVSSLNATRRKYTNFPSQTKKKLNKKIYDKGRSLNYSYSMKWMATISLAFFFFLYHSTFFFCRCDFLITLLFFCRFFI